MLGVFVQGQVSPSSLGHCGSLLLAGCSQSSPCCHARVLVPPAVPGPGEQQQQQSELCSCPGLAPPQPCHRAILGWRNAEEPELRALPVLLEQQRGSG